LTTFEVQLTVTVMTLLVPTVPLPFVTVQSCPAGCVCTVTS
jgi:hypothetical protein